MARSDAGVGFALFVTVLQSISYCVCIGILINIQELVIMLVHVCVQDVTASMDDGLAKVNYVCDQAEKILPNTSVEGKKLIEQQVTELTNDWV